MKNKVFVFDLDDTLYKEIDFLLSAYREIANWIEDRFSLEGIYPFMWKGYKEGYDVFSFLITTFGLSLSKADLLAIYRSHLPNICLSDDTLEVLKILSRDFVVGMITDGRSLTQRNKFRALGLDRFINNDDLVISEEFGSEKPSEKNYLFFVNKYADADFVYVGDNPQKDFVSPKKLGWETICLLDDGRNIHPQDFSCLEAYLPEVKIRNLKELLALN